MAFYTSDSTGRNSAEEFAEEARRRDLLDVCRRHSVKVSPTPVETVGGLAFKTELMEMPAPSSKFVEALKRLGMKVIYSPFQRVWIIADRPSLLSFVWQGLILFCIGCFLIAPWLIRA